jgi:hypothetical protein
LVQFYGAIRGQNQYMSLERFFIGSLIVHLLFVALLLRLENRDYTSKETIELTVLDHAPTKKPQTLVTDPNLQPLKNALKELKDKADFLSKENRRVKEQMIARNTGRTQNRDSQKQQPQREQDNSENQSQRKASRFPKPNEESDLAGTQPAFSKQQRVAERVVLSDSTIAEYVPNVKQGGFTSLNTDQFMYYTFYARINEQIRNRWVNNLQAFSANVGPNEINRLASREQVTELEVILDKDGNYRKTIVHRNSENSQLDAAAAYAIQNASPFLNPPSEILETDGNIHLYYQFHVNWRPQYVAGP